MIPLHHVPGRFLAAAAVVDHRPKLVDELVEERALDPVGVRVRQSGATVFIDHPLHADCRPLLKGRELVPTVMQCKTDVSSRCVSISIEISGNLG